MATALRNPNELPLPLRWLTGIAAVGSAFLAMDSLRLFAESPLLDFVITVQNHYYYALMGLLLPICFLIYPPFRGASTKSYWLDSILSLAAFGACVFFFINAETMLDFGWEFLAPSYAVWVSYLLWALVMEAVRRSGGWVLFSLVLVFSLYPVVADKLPGPISGLSSTLAETASYHVMSIESILGLPFRAYAQLVIGFLIFGIALQHTGGGRFFINLAFALFGHVRGAFTGAVSDRRGKFEVADGGTIFLDEIGEMPLNLQVKLLRVLQERTITKVGATKSESVDIRVVAATNINLETAVKEGKFRDDLYYRLNVVQMRLPPLRQRGDDVVLIARYLINKVCDELRLPPKELGAEAIQALKKFEWPGNIRQLENRLKKAIVLADSAILTPGDLDLSPEVLQETLPLADAKERFAYNYIMEALERNGGNRTQTAKELGVDPRTIFRYLEKELDETT